jgi:hypothetical protein
MSKDFGQDPFPAQTSKSLVIDYDQQAHGTYDVCVLGTSNAVMWDGYVSQISQEKTVRSLVNLSIGGSSSNLFTYRRPDISAGRFNAVIIDFCVNDTTLYSSGIQNTRNIKQSLEEIVCSLSCQGCTPIILMLPLQFYQDNPVPEIYRDVARRFEIPIFDGYKAAQVICNATGLGYGELFEGPFHLKRPISRCLASWMMSAFDRYCQSLSSETDRQAQVSTTRYIPISNMSRTPLPQEERSTSLVTETFSEISRETTVDLDLPDDCCIVAIVADFANSAGILCFAGRINLRICLSSLDLFEGGIGFVLKAWPLPRPVFPHRGSVRLNVLSEHEAGFDVSLKHPLSEGQKQMPVKIVISGLIVRQADRTIYNYRAACRNADLSEIDLDRFVTLYSKSLTGNGIGIKSLGG